MLIFILRISSSLYDGSLQFYYPSTLVSIHNWTVHLELSVHVISVFFTRCHTRPERPGIKPLPPPPEGMVEFFGLTQMRLNWFLMTDWSKLLHQLNSFSQSLNDPVKLVHISGRHRPPPFKPGPLTNPKQRRQETTADSIRVFHRLQRQAHSGDG